MQEGLNRRQFIKKSLVSSTAGALAAARASAGNAADLPHGKIGDLKISRLIIGGNQFSGWSHSRDLPYLRDLFLAYSSQERIMDTLELCEEMGINTMLCGASRHLNKYWKERGGRLQWIAQVHPKSTDVKTNIKRAIDNGAAAAYVQGGVGDSFVKGGRVDLLGKAVDFIRENGIPAGIGGHSVEVPIAVEKAGIKPDFYMKTLHHGNYWSATPKNERVEFNVDSGSLLDHDNIWAIAPERTIEFSSTPSRTAPTSSAQACSTSRSEKTSCSPKTYSPQQPAASAPGEHRTSGRNVESQVGWGFPPSIWNDLLQRFSHLPFPGLVRRFQCRLFRRWISLTYVD